MNGPISEQFRLTAKRWVDADSAANILEELKSATLSQMMSARGDMPVSRAEMEAKSSNEWTEYLRNMVEARSKANLLKVQMEYLRMRFKETESAGYAERAEMGLSR